MHVFSLCLLTAHKQALTLAQHSPVCSRLCCNGLSALFTHSCASNWMRTLRPTQCSPACAASKGCCVTDQGHPWLVQMRTLLASMQIIAPFTFFVRSAHHWVVLSSPSMFTMGAGRWGTNYQPPQPLPTKASALSHNTPSRCLPAHSPQRTGVTGALGSPSCAWPPCCPCTEQPRWALHNLQGSRQAGR